MNFQSSCKTIEASPYGTIHMSHRFCRKALPFSLIVTRGPRRGFEQGGRRDFAALTGGGHAGGG